MCIWLLPEHVEKSDIKYEKISIDRNYLCSVFLPSGNLRTHPVRSAQLCLSVIIHLP